MSDLRHCKTVFVALRPFEQAALVLWLRTLLRPASEHESSWREVDARVVASAFYQDTNRLLEGDEVAGALIAIGHHPRFVNLLPATRFEHTLYKFEIAPRFSRGRKPLVGHRGAPTRTTMRHGSMEERLAFLTFVFGARARQDAVVQ